MRTAFVGTGSISLGTAQILVKDGHEVVMIERNKERIDHLSGQLDCGFLHGDGSTPALLKEVGPGNTDILFCMTGNDKDNIIAGLVGRSLGFARTIVKIEDRDLEHICAELGLEDVIVPTRTISRHLVEMVEERQVSELSTAIKGDARFFTFVAGEKQAKNIDELPLPKNSRLICLYRDGEFRLTDRDSALQEGDEVVILTNKGTLDKLTEIFPRETKGEGRRAESDGR